MQRRGDAVQRTLKADVTTRGVGGGNFGSVFIKSLGDLVNFVLGHILTTVKRGLTGDGVERLGVGVGAGRNHQTGVEGGLGLNFFEDVVRNVDIA
ncbi:hypothetical protein SDC9_206131 [bioreactor metagenome]|uniref:Uncharacterized protein n=1 Tax=bioreactor metagenome TaxID=1076179 RepID=A0A645J4Q8_9ZZZZ